MEDIDSIVSGFSVDTYEDSEVAACNELIKMLCDAVVKNFPSAIRTPRIIHYKAENDRNGNPRRVYVLFDDQDAAVAAWDERYSGCDAVPGDFRNKARNAETRNCSVMDYKLWLWLPSPTYAWEVKGYEHLRTA